MNSRCIVVIGHVDHGKTSLVRALTGTETDRLPEEKARGLSITPGFAHRNYPEGVIDFVDAPGHADFIQGMITGASGAQAALVVIALADGLGAQTREHLAIAGLLGISKAVIAVTKSDALDPADWPARLSGIRAALGQSPFDKEPLVVCSAQTGDGIAALDDALNDVLRHPPKHADARHTFLPIDRAFSLPGRGTIVTGTLLGQDLWRDADMVLQPEGRAVSMRSLESRGETRKIVHTAERMAANLRGITTADIPSGSALCAAGTGAPSQIIDVHLNMLPQAKPLKHMEELRVLFGTANVVGQVRLMKGAADFAQLRFKKPVACFAGQKAILRRLSPTKTVGGATFLDPQAMPARSRDVHRFAVLRAAEQRDIDALTQALIAAGDGCAELSKIARLARLTQKETRAALDAGFLTLDPDLVSSIRDIQAAKTALLDALKSYHLQYPLHKMAPRTALFLAPFASPLLQHVEDRAVADKQLCRSANTLALWGHDPMAQLTSDQRAEMADLEDRFRDAGLNASCVGNEDQSDLMQLLIDTKTLIALPNIALKQTLLFHSETLTQAAAALAAAFPNARAFTTSEARTALSTSRRVIVPLLEHFDSLGVTHRQNDTRQITDMNLVSQPPSP